MATQEANSTISGLQALQDIVDSLTNLVIKKNFELDQMELRLINLDLEKQRLFRILDRNPRPKKRKRVVNAINVITKRIQNSIIEKDSLVTQIGILNEQLLSATNNVDNFNNSVNSYVAQGIPYGGSVEIATAEAEAVAQESQATIDLINSQAGAEEKLMQANIDEAKKKAMVQKIIIGGSIALFLLMSFFIIRKIKKGK